MSDGVVVGNGNQLQVTHTGQDLLPTPKVNFKLSNILHAPSRTHNLLSIH